MATPSSAATTAASTSTPGDVVGKCTVGYQGWYACVGDGSPINAWLNWGADSFQPPSISNSSNVIPMWPDVRSFTHTYQTAYPKLGNGQPASLFSSFDQQTVDTHFRWMRDYGCGDTVALQRFNPNSGQGPFRDAIAAKVRSAAETYGRKFYIAYDVSTWVNMDTEIKVDWTNKMSAYTASPAYAHQNGKPVVSIWGLGINDPTRPFTPAQAMDVVQFFKGHGCYVILGMAWDWLSPRQATRPGFLDVYHTANMISPWMVGAIGSDADSDSFFHYLNLADQADCTANGIDYQPCVLPGNLAARQRRHGDFMWHQGYNMSKVGSQGLYISMFDEIGEGNAIVPVAPTQLDVPVGSGLLSLDEDGTACSADYYLRLTADVARMWKGQIASSSVRPTQPTVSGGAGPTGFEMVTLKASSNGRYVSSNNGFGPLTADRLAARSWEQWALADAGNGNVALRANNGKYVTAQAAGAQPLIANQTSYQLAETFTPVNNPDGTVSLLAQVNHNYVTTNDGNAPLIANQTANNGWAELIVTKSS